MALCLPFRAFAHDTEQASLLWSSFKDLNKSAAACKLQSRFILEQMGLAQLVDKDDGICGVFKGNRVVVECVDQGPQSLLWVAVAVADRYSVELRRNKIPTDIR